MSRRPIDLTPGQRAVIERRLARFVAETRPAGVDVVDDAAGTFTFPRLAFVIRDSKTITPATASK